MTKTQWVLGATIVIALGNAVIPFLSAQVAGVLTIALSGLAFYFHISDVNNAASAVPAASTQ